MGINNPLFHTQPYEIKHVQNRHIFLALLSWPLTHDLEEWIDSKHYHGRYLFQIWGQSIYQCKLIQTKP